MSRPRPSACRRHLSPSRRECARIARERHAQAERAGQARLFPERPGDRLAPPATGGWALAGLVTRGRR